MSQNTKRPLVTAGNLKAILIMSAGLTLVLLLLVWFWNNFEKVEREVDVGYSGEARFNDFLAADRFLDTLTVETESIENLHGRSRLPPADGTLFIPVWRSTFSRTRNEQLRGWVESGGHLVVLGHLGHEEKSGARPDELLEPFGVQIETPKTEDEKDKGTTDPESAEEDPYTDYYREEATPEEPADPWADPPEPDEGEGGDERKMQWDADRARFVWRATGTVVGEVRLPGRERPLQVTQERSETRWEMKDARGQAIWAVPGRDKYRVLQYELGAGLLTVLSGAAFMTNERIGEHDNAELVWRLATWGGRTGGSWIVYGYEVPGLLTLIARHGWMILWSATALLVFWLWRHAFRFGPTHPLPTPPRRSVMEHVDASGRYLWRHGHGRALLEDVQGAVRARAARRVSDWRQLEAAERHKHLAEISGLTEAGVREALSQTTPVSRPDFVDLLQRLHTINRAL